MASGSCVGFFGRKDDPGSYAFGNLHMKSSVNAFVRLFCLPGTNDLSLFSLIRKDPGAGTLLDAAVKIRGNPHLGKSGFYCLDSTDMPVHKITDTAIGIVIE